MKIGDIICTRNIRHYFEKGWAEYKAPDNKSNLVFLFLGCEPKNGSNLLDIEEQLNKLGWEQSVSSLSINMQSRPDPKDARSC